jgi:hypothetical protein
MNNFFKVTSLALFGFLGIQASKPATSSSSYSSATSSSSSSLNTAQEFIFTTHALERMAERKISEKEIADIILKGKPVEDPKQKGCMLYEETRSRGTANKLIVVAKPEDKLFTVITMYNRKTNPIYKSQGVESKAKRDKSDSKGKLGHGGGDRQNRRDKKASKYNDDSD